MHGILERGFPYGVRPSVMLERSVWDHHVSENKTTPSSTQDPWPIDDTQYQARRLFRSAHKAPHQGSWQKISVNRNLLLMSEPLLMISTASPRLQEAILPSFPLLSFSGPSEYQILTVRKI